MRIALVVAVVHLLLFVLTPPFHFEPYKLEAQEYMIVQHIPDRKIPEPVKEIPKPPVEITPADDLEGEDPPRNVFYPRDPFPPPPAPKSGSAPPFAVFDKEPVPTHFETPAYPELAREAGIEGIVHVKVVIDVEGRVVDAAVFFSDVTPSMERAALDAAYRCRFEPARQGNLAVQVSIIIPFEFRLTD
jgi:protein TonB